MEKKKNIIVIEGPSGVGKDSIIKGIIQKNPELFAKMPSVTTRAKRPDEVEGMPYCFVSAERFDEMLEKGEIFEHTVRHDGQKRGMSHRLIKNIIDNGKVAMKDCDVVGLEALNKAYPEQVLSIFITVSKEDIIKRLLARGEDEYNLKVRIADYEKTMEQQKYFDYSVENKDLNKAIDEVHEIIQKANQH